jgi:hypothetical protein
MTTKQTNKLNMYEAVAKVMNENKTLWQDLTILTEVFAELNTLLSELRNVGSQRAKKTTGVTQNKSNKKEAMVKKATNLASSAYAYAERVKNRDLQSKFDYTYSVLFRSDDNNAINQVQAIVEEAEKIVNDLAPFGVKPEEITELKTLVESFTASIGEKSNVKSGRVSATKSLATLFKETDTLLKNQMDKLVLRLADSQATFYQTYQNARAIKDLGSRSKITDNGIVEANK